MGVKRSCGRACAQDASWTANPSEVLQSWCHLPRLSPISFIVSMKTTTALQAAAREEVSYMNFIMQQNCWPQISLQNREKSYLGGRWGRIIISEKIRVKIEKQPGQRLPFLPHGDIILPPHFSRTVISDSLDRCG